MVSAGHKRQFHPLAGRDLAQINGFGLRFAWAMRIVLDSKSIAQGVWTWTWRRMKRSLPHLHLWLIVSLREHPSIRKV